MSLGEGQLHLTAAPRAIARGPRPPRSAPADGPGGSRRLSVIDIYELGVADELEVAARIGGDSTAPFVQQLEQFGHGLSLPSASEGIVGVRTGNSASIARIRSRAMPAITSGNWIDLAMDG